MKTRIRAVLFDYGLTLVRFAFPRECLIDVLERYRPRLAEELGHSPEIEHLMTQVLEKVENDLMLIEGEDEVEDYLGFYARRWHDAGYGVSDELLYEILDDEQRCWDAAMHVEAEVHQLLERLRARGIKTAVVSNAAFPPEMMRRQVAGNGIAPRVDTVVFSSEIGRRKPAPELYREALTRLGVRPDEALFVGDRLLEDYEGPRRLGMQAVLYRRPEDEPPPVGVETVGELSQIESLL
jgi:HAD superfamily hydrolase (TIGR01509 family)